MQKFYLLSLRIAGIKNIEEPLEIKFYKETILNDFDPDQYKIKAIYGENGSGKTAIVTAVKILTNILTDRDYLHDTLTQKNLVENINKKTKTGFIQIDYYVENANDSFIEEYYIGFEVRKDNRFYITSEILRTKKGNYSQNQFKTVLATKNGGLIDFGTSEVYQLFIGRTQNLLDQRSVATFITEIKEEEFSRKDASPLYHVLLLRLLIYSINVFIDEADDHRRYVYSKITRDTPEDMIDKPHELYEEIINHKVLFYSDDRRLISKKNIDEYKKTIAKMCSFVQIFKPELRNIIVETKEWEEAYQCNLIMKYENYSIDSEYESRGIRKLMDLFVVLDKASNGEIAFIDELDASISDVYLGKLIEFFAYFGKGQLCFTAHNLSPMKFLKKRKNSISFISSINTIHTWASDGNRSPESAYRNGFIEDSPFNVDASDFLGVLGGDNE